MQKKKAFLAFILVLFLINLVSAAFYSGYGGFSLGDLLDSIDESTMILGTIFIVAFAFFNFSLSKFFKDKQTGEPLKGTVGVVSFVLSLLIIYGINKSGLDYEGFLYNIGFSGDFLFLVMPFILLGLAIYLVWKFSFATTFMIFGGLIMGITAFTDVIYDGSKGAAFVLGIVLFLIGLWLGKKKHGISGGSPNYNYPPQAPSGPGPKQVYNQELANRRYQEQVRQSQIMARAKNIANIRKEREQRDLDREYRRRLAKEGRLK